MNKIENRKTIVERSEMKRIFYAKINNKPLLQISFTKTFREKQKIPTPEKTKRPSLLMPST
jgi:hypothetical protein